MATTYAALTSLMNLLTQLHEHPQPPIQLDEKQVESLSSSIRYFQKSLEDHHNIIDHGVEIQIASTARAAEELIETHIADRIQDQLDFHRSLAREIQGLDSHMDEVMNRNEKSSRKKVVFSFKYIRTKIASKLSRGNSQPTRPVASSQSPPVATDENFLVGIKDITARIMDKLSQVRDSGGPMISILAYKFHKRQVDSLCSKIHLSQRFVEGCRTGDHALEKQITDAARAAEKCIEAYIADRFSGQENLYGSLQSAIELLDSIMKDASEILLLKNEQIQGSNRPRRNRTPLASSQSPTAISDEMIKVGIEEITNRIVDKLTPQYKSNRQIISISGMGGIGKTTLARNIYDHPCVKDYFDVCAWSNISTDYNTHESLIELLHCLDRTSSKESLSKESEHKLGEKLYQSLIGRRYLVILDDVWHLEAWDRLRFFFPASSGSGIVITTRQMVVASMISSYNFRMDFLDEHKSWELFCNRAFGKDSCPRRLEDVGKYIANKCRGLPLSIVVIGGHLAKSPRTRAYWKYISDNLSSIVNSENDEHCHKILSLSYTHLPVHLKPCFLYMGIFPEDKEFQISEIIRLWIVEGILKPINGKSLEEVAEEYINDLIARNLILASKSSKRGKLKSCKMHDLLRDFCIKREMEENLFYIVQKQGLRIHEPTPIRVETCDDLQISSSCPVREPTPIRTLTHFCKLPFEYCSLLQQLTRLTTINENQSIKYSDAVNLQCLSIKQVVFSRYMDWNIPPLYCCFWNLQYLVIESRSEIKAPPGIWEVPQLRHIKVDDLLLLDPPSESSTILKNLQSAKTIKNLSFSEDLVKRVPNIKRLKVRYHNFEGAHSFDNIARLETLESFECSCESFDISSSQFGSSIRNNRLRDLTLPHSLRKLVFRHIHWDDVTTKIGSLPLLEALSMIGCMGREWNLVEGQFGCLKYLELGACYYLECFAAGVDHFPRLGTLVLHSMFSLKEISPDIGDIPTLRLIELHDCRDSAIVCAKEIADVQCENGIEELQVKVRLPTRSRLSSESLSTANFHIGY